VLNIKFFFGTIPISLFDGCVFLNYITPKRKRNIFTFIHARTDFISVAFMLTFSINTIKKSSAMFNLQQFDNTQTQKRDRWTLKPFHFEKFRILHGVNQNIFAAAAQREKNGKKQ
jgi:hypothetical protein